jgi:hypothetical protein
LEAEIDDFVRAQFRGDTAQLALERNGRREARKIDLVVAAP